MKGLVQTERANGAGPARTSVESLVQESEQRFRIMADAAPVMLWMAREDALCTFFNQTWLDFTGRTQEQEWGVGWAENIYFEDLQHCLDTYVDAFNQRVVFEMEYRLRRSDGAYRWILDRGTPRYAPGGAFAGYIGSCVDITDRRQVEDELRNALRAKQEFFATASHELKSPMAALRLQLERFKRVAGGALSDPQRDLIERMTASSARIAGLIESTLELSRVQDGRVSPSVAQFDLDALLQRVIASFRPSAEHKGLTLEYRAPAPGLQLVSDRALVRTIVSHLLANAIKFTEAGSVEVAIGESESTCTIAVRDSGHGISPAEQANVFEPFQHLESARNKHTPGIGLGLALAKRLAGLLGGEISLESELGRGSVFTLALARSPQREAP